MSSLDPIERFSDRAGDYAKYRPGYPAALYDFLKQAFHLGPGVTVADIGSGTGISSAPLLEMGCRVFAIEPNAAMRAAAERALGDRPGFTSLDGTAENTGLGEGAMDLILAAQAFHWFDVPKARAEFKQVLRPGGQVALLWNERLEKGSAFLEAYEALLHRFGTDYEQVKRSNRVHHESLSAFFGPADTR